MSADYDFDEKPPPPPIRYTSSLPRDGPMQTFLDLKPLPREPDQFDHSSSTVNYNKKKDKKEKAKASKS